MRMNLGKLAVNIAGEQMVSDLSILPNKSADRCVNILYEDADILVCVKPAGVASETKKAGQQDMVSLLRNYRHNKGEEIYIGLVHRLDQPVEGILVFGKHQQSTAVLSRQLARDSFLKGYLAVTEGAMSSTEAKLQHYLKKDGRSNTSYVVSETAAQAKKAELSYKVLATDRNQDPVQNLVRIQLLTGRHHQIRVQMAQIGAPLAGDRKYGRKIDDFAGGLGLCAYELEFVHPLKNKKMNFRIVPSQPVFRKFEAQFREIKSCASSFCHLC